MKKGKQISYIIFKIGDSGEEIVVEETKPKDDSLTAEERWDQMREKLLAAQEGGKPLPRYAVYDFDYEAPNGEGLRYVMMRWITEAIDLCACINDLIGVEIKFFLLHGLQKVPL